MKGLVTVMPADSLIRILDLFPGPAFIVGPGGEILGSNERMGQWSGLATDDLCGRPMAQLVAEPAGQVAAFLAECTRAGQKVSACFTPVRGGGAGGLDRAEGIAIPGGADTAGPGVVAIHMISAIAETCPGAPADRAGSPETHRDDLRRKNEFLGRLAHDLRNPVAAISGALHLVRRATSSEDIAWAEQAMERQLNNLVRQLDDLQDLARLVRGKVEFWRQRLDAAAMARAAAERAQPLIDERQLHLHLAIAQVPGPLTIEADATRLEQVLVGLIRHIARTADRGCWIRLSVRREAGDVVFRVRAEGKDSTGTRECGAGHTDTEQGVGLTLVWTLAEMLGGSVSVRSDHPDAAAEFAVRLPAANDAPASEPSAQPNAGSPTAVGNHAATGTRILIVDDNVDAARSLARLLQLAGHEIHVAHDGPEALEMARTTRPRFVLLDIVLPGMDGYEVARQMRDDPELRDTVIIAVSGYSADDYRDPSDAGFDHHLVKPIDYDLLRAIINPPAGAAQRAG